MTVVGNGHRAGTDAVPRAIDDACPEAAAALRRAEAIVECHVRRGKEDHRRLVAIGVREVERRCDGDSGDRKACLASARAVEKAVSDAASADAGRRLMYGLVAGLLVTPLYAAALATVVVAGFWGFTSLAGDGARAMTAEEARALSLVLAAAAGGGLGAVISVLTRLNRDRRLDFRRDVGALAFRRVVLGWLFATALIALLLAGLTDVVEPRDDGSPTDQLLFAAAAGLVAGFNERLVGDLLHRDARTEEG